MKSRKYMWKIGIAVSMAAVLSGCGMKQVLTTIGGGEKEYGKAETMVILSTERMRYEEVYSEEIWTAAVDENGTAFETVLISQVHDFMIGLKTMSNMAKSEKMELTEQEALSIKKAAAEYFEALGNNHAENFELEETDVEALYTDYRLAEKIVESRIETMDLEISDSEAKVITLYQIEVSDGEEAAEVRDRVTEDGADFLAVARMYSENEEIEKQIYYGLMGKEYEAAAYALEQDEISEIIEDSGKYYVLKCVNDYDEAATRAHKEEIMLEKKNEAFQTSYQSYKAEYPLNGDSELWENLSVTDCAKTEADFFEIYKNAMTENSLAQN